MTVAVTVTRAACEGGAALQGDVLSEMRETLTARQWMQAVAQLESYGVDVAVEDMTRSIM